MKGSRKSEDHLSIELKKANRRIAQLEKDNGALRKTETRFRGLVETGSDFVWEIDEQARYTYVSPQVKANLGYQPNEVLGKTPFDFMPDDEAKRVSAIVGPLIEGRKPLLRIENANRHKDGSLVVFETSGVPIYDENERLFYRGTDRDVTARKHAEWEITIFQKFAESSEQGLGMADAEGNMTYLNRALAKIFGGDPKDLLGKNIRDYYLEDDLPALEEAILPSVMKNVSQTLEMPLVSSDGKATDTIQSIFLIHDKEGKPHFANVITDITDRKDKEKKLLEYQENLEELVKERTAKLEAEIVEGKRREEIIKRQSAEILELSTPVIQVLEGVLVAPLIGTLDSERTQQFMERLLSAIVDTKSRVALVDITGVPTVDTQTAQHLIEAVTAVSLLGAKVVLTGISPPIAQTLVHLGIDLSDVETSSSLAGGLQVAFSDLGLEVVKRNRSEETRGATL